MDVVEKRRLNIVYLADKKYGRAMLAEMLGYQDTNYLNQLCKGFGSFGGRTARKIEVKLGLTHGWMDDIHPETMDSADKKIQRDVVDSMLQTITTNEARELLDDINQLDETQLATVAKMVKGLLPHSPK